MVEKLCYMNNNFYFSNRAKTFCKDLISGAIASGISKTLIAPLETIRLRMQISDILVKKKLISSPYKSVHDSFQRIIKEEGVKALYKGNIYNVLLYFPVQSLNFAIKPQIKMYLSKNNFLNKSPFLHNLLTGSLTGMTTSIIFQPFEFAKTKVSGDIKNKLSGKKAYYNGLIDVFRKEYNNKGIQVYFRGVGASALCMFIYRGLYFGIYDTLNNKAKKNIFISNIISPNNLFIKLIFGFIATSSAGFVAYPFDSIRRRMMIDDTYNSSLECAKELLAKKGLKNLYKGSSAMILRSFAGASILVLFENIKKLL